MGVVNFLAFKDRKVSGGALGNTAGQCWTDWMGLAGPLLKSKARRCPDCHP